MSLEKAVLPAMPGAINDIYNPAGDVFNAGTAFTPSQPLVPVEQHLWPKSYDLAVASNINYIPRQDTNIDLTPFQMLNMLANTDLVNLAISMVIDQIRAKEWDIIPYKKGDKGNYKSDIANIKAMFEKPDSYNDYYEFIWSFMYNVIVYDALTLYKIPTRDKKSFAGLLIVDGSTIKPLITTRGLSPQPPNFAFQQIIRGRVENQFTTQQMIYAPRYKRSNSPYGCSMVERIMITINSMIQKQLWDLNYFTNGSTPDGGLFIPKNNDGSPVTTKQLKEFQLFFDNYMVGDKSKRQGIPMMPEGNYVSTKTYAPNIQFYEWLIKIICFNFGIPQQAFIHQMNRATSKESNDQQGEFGFDPLTKFMERRFTQFIREDLKKSNLKFAIIEDKTADNAAEVEANVQYFNIGARSVNDILALQGKDRIPGGDEHYYNVGNQLIPVDPSKREAMQPQTPTSPALAQDNQGVKSIKSHEDQPIVNKPQIDKGLSKAELEYSDFKKYALNSYRKKKRKFEPKYLAKAFIDDLYNKLDKTGNISEAKELLKANAANAKYIKNTKKLQNKIQDSFKLALDVAANNFIDDFILKYADNPQNILASLESCNFLKDSKIEEQVQESLIGINQTGFDVGISQINKFNPDLDIKFSYEYAAEWAEKRSADLITGIEESTRDMIRDTIKSSLANDEGWQELKQRLVDNYAFSPERAGTIARTESGAAYNIGYIQCARDAGIKKVFVSDGDADEPCAEANGSEWELDEAEANPLSHPNCSREFEFIFEDLQKGDVEWITVKGSHIPIKDGESKKEAVENFLEDKNSNSNKEIKDKLGIKDNRLPFSVPKDAYVSGRQNKDFGTNDTANIMMFSQSYDTAEQYKGEKGSTWIITAGDETNVKEASDNKFIQEVANDLYEDYEDGNLDPDLDELLTQEGNDEEQIKDFIEKLMDYFDPKEIVDSAGFWDNMDLTSWFSNKYEDIDMVKTSNGAIVLNPENVLKSEYIYDSNEEDYFLVDNDEKH